MRGRVLAALCLCALFSLCAAAETEAGGLYTRVEPIFADAFFEEVGNVLFSQSSAVAGNCVVSLKMNGDVYVYDAATEEHSLLCSVPVVPKGTNAPYEQLDAVTRSLAGEAVYQLIGSADSDIVYGYCPISGKIGALTETGIAWRDVALDNSVQMNRGWAYPYDLLYPYVEDETLYAYYDIAQDQEEYDGTASPQGRLLMFDLQTGACEVRELADTYAFCRYEEGALLLLQKGEGHFLRLASYALDTGEMKEIPLSVPVTLDAEHSTGLLEVTEQIAGLAYDAAHRRIVFTDADGLWCSVDGAPFARVLPEETGWMGLSATTQAWMLENGAYYLRAGFSYLAQ